MKQLKLVPASLLLVFATSACSDFFQQDPLAKKAEAIRSAKSKPEKPEPPPPQESDGVRIDAPDYYSFQEGRPDALDLKARVLIDKYKVALVINNLGAFTGATYDAQKGRFAWTPPKGTVMDTDLFRDMLVDVTAVASPLDSSLPILRKSTKVRIVVSRTIGVPEIVKITKDDAKIREGEASDLTVVVKDPDGGFRSDQYPHLEILPAEEGLSLSPFVTIQSTTPDMAAGTWTFSLRLDLQDKEVTRSVSAGVFGLRVVSRFAKSSALAKVEYRVLTDFSKADTTWDMEQEVIPGQPNQIHFLIFDPRREADLTISARYNVPSGADLTCVSSSEGILRCTLDWTPPYNTNEQHLRLILTVTSANSDTSDFEKELTDLWLPLKVRHVPDPKPTPTPTPRPSLLSRELTHEN